MNRNGMSDYIESTTRDSLNEARLFVAGVEARKSRLVEPTVMPRFAVSCDRELMMGLGDLANEFGVRVHTHLAETKPEVRYNSQANFSTIALDSLLIFQQKFAAVIKPACATNFITYWLGDK